MILLIRASMKFFTEQYDESLKDIDLALTIKNNDPKLNSQENDNMNFYLDGILNQLKEKIKEKK